MRVKHRRGLAAFGALVLTVGTAISLAAVPASASTRCCSTLVVGVGHADPANQQPQNGRLLDYTDFFSRTVSVHYGETLDMRWAPNDFHVIVFTSDVAKARQTYPVAIPHPGTHTANGSPQIQLGPGNFPIHNGSLAHGGGVAFGAQSPTCGAVGQKPCVFHGGDDVQGSGSVGGNNPVTGAPESVDWKVAIHAPVGTYSFFCEIHPGMQGTLHVLPGTVHDDHQSDITARGEQQFHQDQADGLAAERAANVVHYTGGAPGTRTYDVSVGVGLTHVHILEMLPQHLNLVRGDKVSYHWRDPAEVHTATFPDNMSIEPPPFDNTGVLDPGNAPPGTLLRHTNALVDSGVLVGSGFHIPGAVQTWSVRTSKGTSGTSPGTYQYHCTVHDFMVGTLHVS